MQETKGQRKVMSVARSNAAVPGSAVGQFICFSASFNFGVLSLLLLSEHDLLLALPAVPSSASNRVYQLLTYLYIKEKSIQTQQLIPLSTIFPVELYSLFYV